MMEVLNRALSLCTSDYGIYMTIGKIFPKQSLADQLGSNISSIVHNPGISLAVISGLHLIIIIIVFPFHLISYLISVPGAWLVWVGVIICLCRFFARCLMFPGYLLPVQRSVAKEILRGLHDILSHKYFI